VGNNVALFGRRELQAHRRFVTGVTASVPTYKEVDSLGNKEWVVDVYIGPLDHVGANIVKDVPISPFARQLVGDVRQPVLLERSKQGRYTLVGRSKTMPAGAQMPEGSILEAHYRRNEFNLTELGIRFIADLTYELEAWGEKPWGQVDKPWQDIRAWDAFGNQVMGGDVDPDDVPPLLNTNPISRTTTRHVVIVRKGWGGADALVWGTDPWGATMQKIVELET
jgi:hypothetical protein